MNGGIKKTVVAVAVVLAVVIVLSFSNVIGFLADYNWFKEVGYTSVYLRQVFAKLIVGTPIFAVLMAFIFLYLIGIKKSYYSHMNIVPENSHEKKINGIILLFSGAMGFAYSFSLASKFWIEMLRFTNSTSFNIKDPIFSKDVGFYVFKLPLINEIFNSLIGFLVFLLFITVIFYFILVSDEASKGQRTFEKDIDLDVRRFRNIASTPMQLFTLAMNQIVTIAVVFFMIVALRNYLDTFNLLYSSRGAAYGASYTDIKITLWVYRVQMILALVSAGVIVYAYMKKKLKLALVAPVIMIAVALVSAGVENLVQNFIVSPNELAKEREYIKHSIKYTQLAYSLDKIVEKDFAAEQNLDAQKITDNNQTIKNISVNDQGPVKDVFKQIQGIRTYYKFNDIDVDRYTIGNETRQVFIAARELDSESLQSKTWLNEHIKYTHGYGIVMAPVNEVTPSGQPNLFLKNIPPVSSVGGIEVKRPEIYFGEVASGYIVVGTSEKEFDYPKGDTNAFTEYEGKAGINLGFFRRLLYSIDQKSFKLLVSAGIDSNSKIILHRNIADRVNKIAPFMQFDQDPYMVLSDEGRLYWIMDGYTLSDRYPYSEPFDKSRLNYIRNSCKVVVDAYNGDVDFYIVDESDPIVNTYSKIFKGLFKSFDDMPADLRAHVRYPKTYFNIQATMYQDYHMNDAEVFYNKEDRWQIARETFENQEEPVIMEPSYTTFKLPGDEKAEFLLSIPYTPKQKQNMVSLLVVKNDGDSYGEIIDYSFPKNKNILGPYQVESKIENQPEISEKLTQWGTGGSKVIRGHLSTIPIENSILYVEPLYIKSDTQDSIPEVKRIIVAYGDKVVMAETLEKALSQMFGIEGAEQAGAEERQPTEAAGDEISGDLASLAGKAAELYEAAQNALKEGSWADYGRYIEELGGVIEKIKQYEENQ
ncbi:hypothetical protein EAL2_c00250 [Peptoclostridium acidaminophilum DSM 3953]|uniref:UPF0182 protein EAL2_c00250 n=1 Tax=Peptoclostridium acidaminophilum DSM 3953 TaxID=1286171 RepID=W8T0X7_PEPAC|nr:UPF0182 family protein [Peptoclostridium acidaminophilum]AHM55389.1 hypothetical protein EAL2_c00250 [Peptoclostridium acidaminophilum DSM 3953]